MILPITVALASTLPCKAIVVDFNDIPNGTLVSANNPYAGILNIEASAGPLWVAFREDQRDQMGTIWVESAISNGYLEVLPSYEVEIPPEVPSDAEFIDEVQSRIMATFLGPVTNVSFDAFTYRQAGYRYTIVDANGVTSNVPGGVTQEDPSAPFAFDTFNLNIPNGSDVI